MARELTRIDISNVPELLRVAEDVRATNTPRVLQRDNEDIAVVVPIAERPRAGRAAPDALIRDLAAGFQSVPPLRQPRSVEEMVRIAAEEHAESVRDEGL
jgi:hypothetical protein